MVRRGSTPAIWFIIATHWKSNVKREYQMIKIYIVTYVGAGAEGRERPLIAVNGRFL